MKIKRLKPGMLFYSPLEGGTKAYGILVKREGTNWSVWINTVEDGESKSPYLASIPGKAIREEWSTYYEFYK